MLAKVTTLISEYACIDPKKITSESHIQRDLGLNSYEIMNLVCCFEEVFGVEIPDRKIKDLQCVGDIVTFIENNVS